VIKTKFSKTFDTERFFFNFALLQHPSTIPLKQLLMYRSKHHKHPSPEWHYFV